MPNPQSELRIFISSTFHDLQEEREYLVKKVFPEVRQLCRERGIEFTEIDLRWGLTEEEATQGKVIRTCLEEIDRCRPYFIGIIGSRYGWVPKYSDIQRDGELLQKYPWVEDDVSEGKSLVEIEFDYGALRTPEAAEFAFFYSQREHVRSHRVFTEIAKDEKEKLGLIKTRIQNSGLPLREFSGPETLGEHIYNDLVSVIEKRWQKEDEMQPLKRERMQHETFAASRRHAYISNPANTKILNQAAETGKRLIIHAESGAGKSALLAHWAHNFHQRNPNTFIIEHYAGIGSGADHIGLLTHIISEIKDHLKIEDEIPAEPEKIVSDFPLWLSRLSEGHTVLVIDALNQLDEKSHHLGWMPEHLPENISIIASTTSDEMTATLTSRGWNEMSLKPLSMEEREAIIVRFLSEYHKALSSAQLKRIANDPKSISPLFLRTLLEELRIIGNFDKLDLIITHYISANDTDELFQKVLERMEEDYGSRTVREVMSLLYASRKGLSEHELDDVIPISRAKLAGFLMALDYHLHRRDGLLTFFHDYLRRAVEARYAATPEKKKKLHGHIAEYMSKQPSSSRRADEEPWQWLQCEEGEKLRNSLVDLPLFEILAEKERQYELLGYWRKLEGKYDIVKEYDRAILNLDKLGFSFEKERAVLHALSNFYNVAGFYSASSKILSQTIKLTQQMGLSEVEAATEKEMLAEICFYQSDLEKAKDLYQECMQIYKQHYGSLDKRTLSMTDSYGSLNILCNQLEKGIDILTECLAVYEKLYPNLTSNIFAVLNNLGDAFNKKGDQKKAIEFIGRSLLILEKKYGESPMLIIPLYNLGVYNRRLGLVERAEECYDRAIFLTKKYLGTQHPTYAKILFNKGVLYYFAKQDYQGCINLLSESFQVSKKTLGYANPETIKILTFLGDEAKEDIMKKTAIELIDDSLLKIKLEQNPNEELIRSLEGLRVQFHSKINGSKISQFV